MSGNLCLQSTAVLLYFFKLSLSLSTLTLKHGIVQQGLQHDTVVVVTPTPTLKTLD